MNHQVKGQNATKLDRQKLAQYVQQHPDVYLHEIAQHFDYTQAAVCYAFKQMGITRKKRPPLNKEQDSVKVAQYLAQLNELSDYQRIYLDETGFDTYLFRPYARSLKGQIVKVQISGKKYKRLSLVAAQIGNQLIAPMTYQNTMTSAFFEEWFGQWLLPKLTQKSVIILDNARFHRMGVLREMAEKLGHKAPYSPKLNPIEHVWANIKRYMRTVLPDYEQFNDALLSYFYFE